MMINDHRYFGLKLNYSGQHPKINQYHERSPNPVPPAIKLGGESFSNRGTYP